jgi:uncharacterized protein YecE (DUF72 family)
MALYIGTSGWGYREWKPAFYPRGLPQARFLEHYGRSLNACEINATFYRMQSDATMLRWSSATPESFRFATKAHRRITHGRSMAPDSEGRSFLDTFLKSVSILGPRLGVVLFQFPPNRSRDDAALTALLEALPPGTSNAFEFRHESWNDPEVEELIAAAGGTVCISDTAGAVPTVLPAGPLGYVRLRTERYTDETRAAWWDLLEREASRRNVFAFAKHEGIPAEDPYGGMGLAQWLLEQHRTTAR